MSLKESERIDIVKFRLEKAKITLAQVPVLIENQFYGIAANRLYYACFYAVTALLIKDGFEAHSHSGVKTLLGLNYIVENKLDESAGKIYNRLFNMRQKGDYADCVYIKEEDINPLIEPTELFIKTIENLINNSN